MIDVVIRTEADVDAADLLRVIPAVLSLLAGSDGGGMTSATNGTLLRTEKMNSVDQQPWLTQGSSALQTVDTVLSRGPDAV